MIYIWVSIIILLILIERFQTRTIFYTVGAVLAFVLALFDVSFYIQFILFAFTGTFLLVKLEKQTIEAENFILNKLKIKKQKNKNNKPKTKGPKTNKKNSVKKGKTNGKNKKHK